jgi:hypothetical protein
MLIQIRMKGCTVGQGHKVHGNRLALQDKPALMLCTPCNGLLLKYLAHHRQDTVLFLPCMR